MKWQPDITEDQRRTATTVLTYVGWWGALLLTIWDVGFEGPRDLGIIIVFLIGVAIAASSARSRMKLAATITRVFEAGLSTSLVLQANIVRRTCVIELDGTGKIISAENPDLIAWPRGILHGKSAEELIPDRYLREYNALLRNYQDNGATPFVGPNQIVPVLASDHSTEKLMRLSVARVGGLFVATLVPVSDDEDLAGTHRQHSMEKVGA